MKGTFCNWLLFKFFNLPFLANICEHKLTYMHVCPQSLMRYTVSSVFSVSSHSPMQEFQFSGLVPGRLG